MQHAHPPISSPLCQMITERCQASTDHQRFLEIPTLLLLRFSCWLLNNGLVRNMPEVQGGSRSTRATQQRGCGAL